MHNDLLDAQACIDWAVSKFPNLERCFEDWISQNLEIEFIDPDPKLPNWVVAVNRIASVPRSFHVEVGAYINTVRSSLDLLATTLAYRYGVPNPDSHYFPVISDNSKWDRFDYKGSEFVKGLPEGPRAIIESFQPYIERNKHLALLHSLDIERKHRRLLTTDAALSTVQIGGVNAKTNFTPVHTGYVDAGDKTVFGLWPKGIEQPEVQFTAFMTFDHPQLFRVKVTTVLRTLSAFAASVIQQFDSA